MRRNYHTTMEFSVPLLTTETPQAVYQVVVPLPRRLLQTIQTATQLSHRDRHRPSLLGVVNVGVLT